MITLPLQKADEGALFDRQEPDDALDALLMIGKLH